MYNAKVIDTKPIDENPGRGNAIFMQITDDCVYKNMVLAYFHLKEKPDFKKRDDIKAGDVVGTVGSSGTNNIHLHLQISPSLSSPKKKRINLNDLFREKRWYDRMYMRDTPNPD